MKLKTISTYLIAVLLSWKRKKSWRIYNQQFPFNLKRNNFKLRRKRTIKNESKCISAILSYFDLRQNYR